jgi:hypothetical protein
VEAHVGAIAHPFENVAETVEIILGNFRLPLTETDRRNDTGELDGFNILFDDLTHLAAIPLILLENGGVEKPGREGLVGGEVHLGRLSAGSLLPGCRGLCARKDSGSGGDEEKKKGYEEEALAHRFQEVK